MQISVRGLTFEVHVGGPEGGAALLLLHGFPQHAGEWEPVSELLHAYGYQTIAPDQRGYSPGARPEDPAAYEIGEPVADALAILDALEIGTVHVVGHDWGAVVGWNLAASHADRIATLTAISVPHPGALVVALTEDPEQPGRLAYFELFRTEGRAEEVLLADDAARLRAMFAGCPAERVDGYVARMREPGALAAALNWYRAPSSFASTGPVEVPTAFVWGDRDLAVGPVAARRCADWVRGPYRFVPLTGFTHWVPEEAPVELAEVIRALATDQ